MDNSFKSSQLIRFTYSSLFTYLTGTYSMNQPRQKKNTCLYTHFCNTVITFLIACFAAISKWIVRECRRNTRPVSWPWHVGTGTYCCVFIMLLEERIVAVQNSNIWGVGNIPYTKHNPLDSVSKCKSDIKTHLLIQLCYFNFLMWIVASFVSSNCSFTGFLPELIITQV